MKKSYLKLIAFLVATVFASSGYSQSDNDGSLILSVSGVVNDTVSDVQTTNSSNDVNFGVGVLVEAGINDRVGIETGALLINRQYDAEAADVRLVQEVKRLHIPVLARFWATDYFSIAAGPFIAIKTGDTKTTLEVADSEIGSVNTSANDSTEYGLDAAMTFNFAVNDKTGIFAEGRYSALLSQKDNEDANQLSGLAGVKIDI